MSDQNDFQFDAEALKHTLVSSGLDPQSQHDLRLFSAELKDGATIQEAAARAGERKARAAQGSGFDQLNSYFQAMREQAPAPGEPQQTPDRSKMTALDLLTQAIHDATNGGKQ